VKVRLTRFLVSVGSTSFELIETLKFLKNFVSEFLGTEVIGRGSFGTM
jgi:hypothetical protein